MASELAKQIAGDLAKEYIEKAESLPEQNRTKDTIKSYEQELADKLNERLDKLDMPRCTKVRERIHFLAHNLFYNAGSRWIFDIVYGNEPAYLKRT